MLLLVCYHETLTVWAAAKLTGSSKRNKILLSLLFFFIAGLCEIGGGYLVWLWLREDMSWVLGAIGGFILFLYGIVPTFQPSYFHRIYAAYGGVFIAMAYCGDYCLNMLFLTFMIF